MKDGRRLVDTMIAHRQSAINAILTRIPTPPPPRITELLSEFSAAGGRPAEHDLWSMGSTTEAVG